MTKPDKQETSQKEKTETDHWRDAQRNALIQEDIAKRAREKADELGSALAKKLCENHNGATVDLDGNLYAPKQSAGRKQPDGTIKSPRLSHQLVTYRPKSSVDI